MEKHFIVTEKAELYKDYYDYKNNFEEIRKLVDKFFNENGIETTLYGFYSDNLCIVPKGNDLEKFGNVLGKEVGDGLMPFKGNSKIHKSWVKTLEENNIEIKRKPYVPMYFLKHGSGKMWSNLFDIDDIVYCYYKVNSDFEAPEGFIEIKASEYWTVIEDYNEKILGKKVI